MSSAYLFFEPTARPLTLSGALMPGAQLQFYLAGTTTPTDVYADASLGTALSNPVVADADGRFVPIYLDPLVTYRVQLYDSLDVLQYDVDPYAPPRDVPPGTIVLFFGDETARDAAYSPVLYAVCDGTSGTPDLVGRFPKGVDAGEAAGDTGGSANATTSVAGAHDHGGAVSAVALDETQMPVHNHRVLDRGGGSGIADGSGLTSVQSLAGIRNVAEGSYVEDNSLGTPFIEPTGEADPATHDHVITSDGDHDHTVSVLPPYCSLWFLMRLP